MERWTCRTAPLTLDGAAACRARTIAPDEVHRQGQHRGQQGGRHIHVVDLLALGRVDDVVELHGHWVVLAPGEDQTEQEIIPDAGGLQDQCDDEDRQRHRQHQLEIDAPEAAAVDTRGLEQLDRQAAVIVAKQQRHDRHAEDGVDQHDVRHRLEQVHHRKHAHQRVEHHRVRNERAQIRMPKNQPAHLTRQ
jgi:hypothetical protein